ncbi:MAG: flhA [Pseudoduganella sp.]|jgi:flagellar biosynthesis protein FlhA|nr:flhA [Pseudoduganella sp.]
MNALRRVLGQHADIALVLVVVGVLVVLFTPIPAGLLDFLILANVSFALLILLLTFYMAKPVEFSTFPSLLLVATLFRLALNVAATRLILSDADAGRVIGAIGSYVVGGNYVIGLIVFLILVVVQFVVVTSGAQRVSEVAARFTLDSMPGQQMSIDADLNMGFIDQAEAQRRRRNLSKEAGFYGAMDGASKFVKGDAIAGIVIMLINIIGGLVIGVMQLGLPFGEALRTFTLLTIGDGIVTQVPALVISVGTGLIVTRSASDDNLSSEVLKQVTAFNKTIVLVACALGGLLLLPGIPALPVLLLMAFFAVVAWFKLRAGRAAAADETVLPAAPEDDYSALSIEALEVQLGTRLVQLAGTEESGALERIAAFRKQFAQESGLILPSVRVREGAKLAPDAYEISIFGVTVARGEVLPGYVLAIHGGGASGQLRGIETREPAFGLPALWIEDSEREAAKAAKYTLVDPLTVLITHLCEVLRNRAGELLTRQETERLLGCVREQQQGLVEEVVPTLLAVGEVQKVLQNLLREKVSIRNLAAVMETLADHARHSKDLGLLGELVRQRLGAAICQALVSKGNALQVLTLDPALEHSLLQAVREAQGGSVLFEPRLAEQLMAKLAQQADKMMKSSLLPVLLCTPELRRPVRALCERLLPNLRVLSLAEVPGTLELRAFGSVAA